MYLNKSAGPDRVGMKNKKKTTEHWKLFKRGKWEIDLILMGVVRFHTPFSLLIRNW